MPTCVDDYSVLYTIGSGSYGTCKKIRRRKDKKVLVWKEMDYGTMTEDEKQLLVSEVNLLRELRHPNIVRYYDRIIDKAKTTIYIVMEYCEGGDLSHLIAKCRREGHYLEEEFVWTMLVQLLKALSECHKRQNGKTVLHRDLKPANVFLDSNRNAKLGDFGLARVLHHDTSMATTFVGTPYYMSPEQMNRLSYNEKSDVWSLGCLLYELCALRPPFTATNQKELAIKIRHGRFIRIPARYSDELANLIHSMLKVKGEERPTIDGLMAHSSVVRRLSSDNRNRNTPRAQRRRGVSNSTSSDEAEKKDQEKAVELRRWEERLTEREKELDKKAERLKNLERAVQQRELLAEEKLKRAENAEVLLREQHLSPAARPGRSPTHLHPAVDLAAVRDSPSPVRRADISPRRHHTPLIERHIDNRRVETPIGVEEDVEMISSTESAAEATARRTTDEYPAVRRRRTWSSPSFYTFDNQPIVGRSSPEQFDMHHPHYMDEGREKSTIRETHAVNADTRQKKADTQSSTAHVVRARTFSENYGLGFKDDNSENVGKFRVESRRELTLGSKPAVRSSVQRSSSFTHAKRPAGSGIKRSESTQAHGKPEFITRDIDFSNIKERLLKAKMRSLEVRNAEIKNKLRIRKVMAPSH